MKIPVLRNDTFLLCWHYGTDASVRYCGWVVDNVRGIGFDRLSSNIKENDKYLVKETFLYDNLGRKVFNKNLSKGIYFLILKNKDLNLRRKLIILK